jgi:glutamyl-Q tRNA(Asp) synthetase
MSQQIFRFAPTPNGQLHLGHAYSALLNQRMAVEAGGTLLLRLEDTDQTRCTPTLAKGVLQDLHWLGLSWPEPVRVQSQHFADYGAALESLWKHGHIYPCFCSRKIAANQAGTKRDPEGQPLYGGTCSGLSPAEAQKRMTTGEAHGWRLRTADTLAHEWGDVVIAKPKTGSWYHIAVVVDDAAQGITHVVRGKDLEAATSIHTVLQHHLGLPHPHYHHHDLLLDEDGKKFSKSRASRSLASLRDSGLTAAVLRQNLGFA